MSQERIETKRLLIKGGLDGDIDRYLETLNERQRERKED